MDQPRYLIGIHIKFPASYWGVQDRHTDTPVARGLGSLDEAFAAIARAGGGIAELEGMRYSVPGWVAPGQLALFSRA